MGTLRKRASASVGPDWPAVVFVYTVEKGDEDEDGVSVPRGSIALNGGKILDLADNAASRNHEGLDPQTDHKVDGAEPDFAHFGNGVSGDDVLITSDLVLVNVGEDEIRPVIYFVDRAGELIEAESVVDVENALEVEEEGGLSPRNEVAPLGELTISPHGRGNVVTGSVRVISDGPHGGRAVPGAAPAGSDPDGGGVALESVDIRLNGNGQHAGFIEELFTRTDTRNFVGSVRCTAPGEGMFTGVAVELDTGNRIFTTLPVVPFP